MLSGLASADLTVRIGGEYRGALGQLKSDTNAVAERFSEVIAQLRDASGALKTATGEILSGANDLSERTTIQATTIKQTAAAMAKLAMTVGESAEKAEEASSNAAQVSKTADEGGQVMRETTAAMERIAQSSGKISNIIGLIDDIAFQTNLLALNASVKQRAPVMRARGSRSSLSRCAGWLNLPRVRHPKSRNSSNKAPMKLREVPSWSHPPQANSAQWLKVLAETSTCWRR